MTATARTLGGLRPGCPTVLDPAAPTLVWMPCFRRALDDAGGRTTMPHCWFLAPSNHPSFHCPACYARMPHVVIVPRGHNLSRGELLKLAGFEVPDTPEWMSAKEDVGSFEAPAPTRVFATRAEWLEEFTERAAIFEYLGGLPREMADMMARAEVGNEPR